MVIDGADRLKEGAKVVVREAPGANPAPATAPAAAGKGTGQHRHRPGAQPTASDHGSAPPAQ